MSIPFSPKFCALYDRIAPLGEGGMAVVYRARQRELDRPVAIKVLRDLSTEQRARFEREARVLASLVHPNILRVFDAGMDGDLPFLVCELIEGESLAERIERGRLPVAEALGVARAVAEALAHAHGHGFVHRDVKPANVLCPSAGPLRLGDFGLARTVSAGSTLTAAGVVMGTPQYMAPEQVLGDATSPASDQYALGAMLYELLTGRTPFAGDSALEQLQARLERQPEPVAKLRPDLPPGVEALVERMLRRTPAERFPDMTAVVRAIAALPESNAGPPAPGVPSAREPATTRRSTSRTIAVPREPANPPVVVLGSREGRRWPLAALALVVAGLLGAVAFRARIAPPPVSPSGTGASPPGSTPSTTASLAPSPAGRVPVYRRILAHPEVTSGIPNEQRCKELAASTGVPIGFPEQWAYWYGLARWLDRDDSRDPPKGPKAKREPMDEVDQFRFFDNVKDKIRGEAGAALARILNGVALWPADARPWLLLGWHLEHDGNPAAAARAYRVGLSRSMACGAMKWPDWMARALVAAVRMVERDPVASYLARVEACDAVRGSAWFGMRIELDEADPKLSVRILEAAMKRPEFADAAGSELATYQLQIGDLEGRWRTLDVVLARFPEAERCSRLAVERHALRGDRAGMRAMVENHKVPVQFLRLPELLWPASAGLPPEVMTFEEARDEAMPRTAYLARLVEARSPTVVQLLHDFEFKLREDPEVYTRLLFHALDAQPGSRQQEETLRAGMEESATFEWTRWSEVASIMAASPKGRVAALFESVAPLRTDLVPTLIRGLAASRRGDHDSAAVQLAALLRDKRTSAIPLELLGEILVAPLWQAAMDHTDSPLAQSVRARRDFVGHPSAPDTIRRLLEYIRRLQLRDFAGASRIAQQGFLYQPAYSIWGESVIRAAVLAGDDATRIEWTRRCQAAWRAGGVNLNQVRDLENYIAPRKR